MNPTIVQAYGRTFAWLDDGAAFVFVDNGGSRAWAWSPEPRLDLDGRVVGSSYSGRRCLLWLDDGRAYLLGISPSLGYQLERLEVADLTVERVEASVAARLAVEQTKAQKTADRREAEVAQAEREHARARAEVARREVELAELAEVARLAAEEVRALQELKA